MEPCRLRLTGAECRRNLDDHQVERPFRVKGMYWLLDQPLSNSRIVQRHIQNLVLPTAEFADFVELKHLVDGTMVMLDDDIKAHICIGSQCNRLIKHFETSAIYLANYKGIAASLIENLHQAMKWLFSVRPPRELAAKELLDVIAKVSAIVYKSAKYIFSSIKKVKNVLCSMSTVAAISSIFDSEFDTREFHFEILENVNSLLAFWEKLTCQFKLLLDLSKEINPVTAVTGIVSKNGLEFEEFKERVIEASSGWIAVKSICQTHNQLLSPDAHLFIETKCNLNTSSISIAFIHDVRVHFEEINATLMIENYELMKDTVPIYSTWVQPKLNVGMDKCLEQAFEALELRSNASNQFLEVKKQCQQITATTKMYVQRLRVLEEYAECQQKILVKSKIQLENQLMKKQKLIETKQNSIVESEKELKMYDDMIYAANQSIVEAERKKEEIQKLVQDQDKDFKKLEDKIKEVEEEKKDAESKLRSALKKRAINRKPTDDSLVCKPSENEFDMKTSTVDKRDEMQEMTKPSKFVNEPADNEKSGATNHSLGNPFDKTVIQQNHVIIAIKQNNGKERREIEDNLSKDHVVDMSNEMKEGKQVIKDDTDDEIEKEIEYLENKKLDIEEKLERIEKLAENIITSNKLIYEASTGNVIAEVIQPPTENARYEKTMDSFPISWLIKVKNSLIHHFKKAIKCNSENAIQQEQSICTFENKKKKLQEKIRKLEKQVTKFQNDVKELSLSLSQKENESADRIETRQKMAEATATLKEAIFLCDDFMATMEHVENRVEFAKKISEAIEKRKTAKSLVKSGKGTQITFTRVKDLFKNADELLKTQWQHIVNLKYVCALCNKNLEGLPLPVDRDAVVCCSCAKILI